MTPPARTPGQRKHDTLNRLDHDIDAALAREAPHGFQVVIENVRTGLEDDPERFEGARYIRECGRFI